jgi:glucose dehydrogenase
MDLSNVNNNGPGTEPRVPVHHGVAIGPLIFPADSLDLPFCVRIPSSSQQSSSSQSLLQQSQAHQWEARMKQLDTAGNSTAPGAIVAALASWLLASTAPAYAADVTYERLLNPEPQNWLMHHGDFNAQRYSPLEVINKSNAKI